MRRDFLDIVFIYNCFNDRIDFNVFNYLEEYNMVANTRSQDVNVIRFKVNISRLEASRHFFRYRLPAVWNNIPKVILEIEICDSGNTNCCKRHLKSWLNERLKYFNPESTCTWTVKCKCPRCRLV